jgi:hypothetical protein
MINKDSPKEVNMPLIRLLKHNEAEILEDAIITIENSHLRHYSTFNTQKNRKRLNRLQNLLQICVKKSTLTPIKNYIEAIAKERFFSGFDLKEVLTSINILEEIIWKKVIENLKLEECADALSTISTVFGTAKSSLTCTYVSLASHTKNPKYDVSALFKGT